MDSLIETEAQGGCHSQQLVTPGLLVVLSPCHISTPALFQASSCYSGPRCALYPMWTHLLTLDSPPQQQFLLSSRI